MKVVFCFSLLFYFCSCAENNTVPESAQLEEVKDAVYQNNTVPESAQLEEVKDAVYQNNTVPEMAQLEEVKDAVYQNNTVPESAQLEEVKDAVYQNNTVPESAQLEEVKDTVYQNNTVPEMAQLEEVKDAVYQNNTVPEMAQLEEVKDAVYQNDDNLKDEDQYQDSIIRPCPLQDINCIRGFFAHYSQCLIIEGPAPDPYVLDVLPNIPIPHANLTYDLVNPQIKGLNSWKIEEFYINKATDRLVLEVVFDKIVVSCPDARLIYNRKGKEPIVVPDFTYIEYDNLSFTLTIPHIKYLQISRGNVYTYINDAAPKFTLGPGTFSNKDPGFNLAVTELMNDVPLALQEVFVTQGPVFFFAFFRSSICDFRY